jgi:hypothetical protein
MEFSPFDADQRPIANREQENGNRKMPDSPLSRAAWMAHQTTNLRTSRAKAKVDLL